jgi:hypothetical protein
VGGATVGVGSVGDDIVAVAMGVSVAVGKGTDVAAGVTEEEVQAAVIIRTSKITAIREIPN